MRLVSSLTSRRVVSAARRLYRGVYRLIVPGTKVGRLTVGALLKPSPPQYRVYYLCVCACGREKLIRSDALLNGKTFSCAGPNCYRSEVSAKKRERHGFSRHPLYGLWAEMHRRCENPKAHNFHLYGGRGIKVCERWSSIENFIADMPERPSRDYSIDRTDNNKGYHPGNCTWKTPKEQSLNTRTAIKVCIDGRDVSFNEARKILGLTSDRPFRAMMKLGLTAQEAVDRVRTA